MWIRPSRRRSEGPPGHRGLRPRVDRSQTKRLAKTRAHHFANVSVSLWWKHADQSLPVSRAGPAYGVFAVRPGESGPNPPQIQQDLDGADDVPEYEQRDDPAERPRSRSLTDVDDERHEKESENVTTQPYPETVEGKC